MDEQKKENLKSLFTNTRTRIIILFTFLILTIAVGIALFRISLIVKPKVQTGASLVQAPGAISSIPGSSKQTEQYLDLQHEQNINNAVYAQKTGTSAIPTILKVQKFSDNAQPIPAPSVYQPNMGTTLTGANSLWLDALKKASCSKTVMNQVLSEGAGLDVLRQACNCTELKAAGYNIQSLNSYCSCPELKEAGFSVIDFKQLNYTAAQLKTCGFSACALSSVFSPSELKQAGFTAAQLLGAGFSPKELEKLGFPASELQASQSSCAVIPSQMDMGPCSLSAIKEARDKGETAGQIRAKDHCSAAIMKAAGFTASQLKDAGYSAKELKDAGFTPSELRNAGFTAKELKDAGFSAQDLKDAGFTAKQLKDAGFSASALKAAGYSDRAIADAGFSAPALEAAGIKSLMDEAKQCSPEALRQDKTRGMTALEIRKKYNCSATAMKSAGFSASDLKNAGYSAQELRNAGFSPNELKDAGFSAKELAAAGFTPNELKDAGFSAKELAAAGFTPKELKDAGFSAKELAAAGFTPKELKDAGFSAKELAAAGFSPKELKDAGFSAKELADAGFSPEALQAAGLGPNLTGQGPAGSGIAGLTISPPTGASSLSIPSATVEQQKQAIAQQLKDVVSQQQASMAELRHKQEIQNKASAYLSAANSAIQVWKATSTQSYNAGNLAAEEAKPGATGSEAAAASGEKNQSTGSTSSGEVAVKMGDIIFAVLDTTVNTDEPSPILATVVTGRLKGSKLIGSFTLPPNSNKMIIMFNNMSIPGAKSTISINAYAIDPNTARTALSGRVDHHYLSRYGSMFAASFLQGFGNAFQSANTTVTIGGTGGGDNITVQNGIGRSALQNAVIGLSTVGQSWGQVAQQNINQPVTVEVFSGTGLGILFVSDLIIPKSEL
jgi:intracellular multiplication protein IcmE